VGCGNGTGCFGLLFCEELAPAYAESIAAAAARVRKPGMASHFLFVFIGI
jgi:hypothetical protein